MLWAIETNDHFDRENRYYVKKHPAELAAVTKNLDRYFGALNAGAKPQQITSGFVHPEQSGVKALDESGSKGSLAATRLYIYPDDSTNTLHLITIGDKNSQGKDVQFCKEFVADLRYQAELAEKTMGAARIEQSDDPNPSPENTA
jgi:hypothetical protein